MAAPEDRHAFIQFNLCNLVENTVLSVELINHLFQNGLITKSELNLMNGPTEISKTVTNFYTNISCKWTDDQFERFLDVLKITGNLKVYDIFTVDLTKSQIGFLKEEMIKANFYKSGAYEGITKESEDIGNSLAQEFASGTLFSGETFLGDKSQEERKNIVSTIKKFISGVEFGAIWFNNWKPVMPENYIDRTVVKTENMHKLRRNQSSLLDLTLEGKEKLVLLVDGPGMGKSSALHKLELDLRSKMEIPQRIIIRINLNEFCGTLQKRLSNQVTLDFFLMQFADQIPLDALKKHNISQVSVYILLDGLDEVLPIYKDAMMKVLIGLLNYGDENQSLCVAKVVLTTRQHLKEMIEKEFGIQSVSLCPLEEQEQIDYLINELNIPSTDEVRHKIKSLPEEVVNLLSNPLMLNMYSQVCRDHAPEDLTDLYSLYSGFVDRKHELYLTEKEKVDPALPSTIRRRKNFLTNVLPVYNHIAIEQYLQGRDMELMFSFSEGQSFLKQPEGDDADEILSYGLIVIEKSRYRFKHRSFAEFFYARMMTKATDKEFKNVLFAKGYKDGNLVSKFLKYKLKDTTLCCLVSSGWTKHTTNLRLSEYKATEKQCVLFDHIMTNTIEYDKECPIKNQFLVKDSYEEQLFVRWLNERPKEQREWVQGILLNDRMSEVLASVAFSGRKDTQLFVENWLLGTGGLEPLKKSLMQCQDAIHIAVKWKYVESKSIYPDNLLQRMRRWLTLQEVKECARRSLGSDDKFEGVIVANCQFSRFYASVFSKDELLALILDEEKRVTDIAGSEIEKVRTCWGQHFCPKELLKFRFKFGWYKGKSLFASNVPECLMNRVYQEAEANVYDAVQVIMNDGDFTLVHRLERYLMSLEAKGSVLVSSEDAFSAKEMQLQRARWKLVREILIKVDWSNFDAKAVKWDRNFHYFIGYAMLDSKETWEKILQEKKLDLEKLECEDLDTVFQCLVQSSVNEEKDVKVPGEMVSAQWDSVKKLMETCTLECTDLTPFLDIVKGRTREDIIILTSKTSKECKNLSKVPSVWEVLFLARELAHSDSNRTLLNEQITAEGWEEVLFSILNLFYEQPCTSLSVLEGVRQVLDTGYGQVTFKEVMKSLSVKDQICNLASQMWEEDEGFSKMYIGRVIGMYLDVFGDEWEWLNEFVKYIPLQLCVIGAENGWTELVRRVQDWICEEWPDWFSLFINITGYYYRLRYNRCCDWYRLLKLIPEINETVPLDFMRQTEVFLNWECCLLRVWIRVFGEEKTKKEADEKVSDQCFWEIAAKDMKDGELLHIAVQVGSHLGVKETAWPGMLGWRDEKNKNKTALEFLSEKWGEEHEITEYLLREYEEFIASGYLQLQL